MTSGMDWMEICRPDFVSSPVQIFFVKPVAPHQKYMHNFSLISL